LETECFVRYETWNRLYNKYYSSPNIITVIKSEKVRWDVQAA
jgi:hypothetical protein